MNINKEAPLEDVISYVHTINNNHAVEPKMDGKFLERIVEGVYEDIHKDNYEFKGKSRERWIHYGKGIKISSAASRRFAKRCAGLIKRFETSLRIRDAKDSLSNRNIPITKNAIAKEISLSLKTVQRNFDMDQLQFELELANLKAEISSVIASSKR
jgi:hypothetical protein